MVRWHRLYCQSPKIAFSYHASSPECLTCGARAPGLDSQPMCPPKPPTINPGSPLDLKWPLNVKYINKVRFEFPEGTIIPEPEDFRPYLEFNDEIRLVRLTKGQANEHVHISMETMRLRDPFVMSLPEFDALSSTWCGNIGASQTGRIFVGRLWDVIPVPTNYKNALKSIRLPHRDRLVWVDWLCINQVNAEEKSRQVGLLYEIYTKASKVLAYLGNPQGRDAITLQHLKYMTLGSQMIKEEVDWTPIFNKPFFKRLWVAQEIRIAKRLEFFSGHYSFPWPDYLSINEFPLCLPQSLIDRQNFTPKHNVFHILLHNSQYECTDPRGKIFGPLAFTPIGITPDYTLPVEAVYIGITAYILEKLRHMDVLALATIQANQNKPTWSLPSWVPDWCQKHAFGFLLQKIRQIPVSHGMNHSRYIKFNNKDIRSDILIDSRDASLTLGGLKLCDINAETSVEEKEDHMRVTLSKKSYGSVVLSIFEKTYRIGNDSVFVLDNWDHPVILRSQSKGYSLVAVGSLSYIAPKEGNEKWLLPWKKPGEVNDGPAVITVAKFASEENNHILAFDSILLESTNISDLDIIPSCSTARVLDFLMLYRAGITSLESHLISYWEGQYQKFGGIFERAQPEDLLMGIMFLRLQVSLDSRKGYTTILDNYLFCPQKVEIYCPLEYPQACRWNLVHFFASFLKPPCIPPRHIEDKEKLEIFKKTPFYSRLLYSIDNIREWAQTTVLLLQALEYTSAVMSITWPAPFPGSSLPQLWKFIKVNKGATTYDDIRIGSRDDLWSWDRFRRYIAIRKRFWSLLPPPKINPYKDDNIGMHLAMRGFDLRFDNQREVDIR